MAKLRGIISMNEYRIPLERLQTTEIIVKAKSLKKAIKKVEDGFYPSEGEWESPFGVEVNTSMLEDDTTYYGLIKEEN